MFKTPDYNYRIDEALANPFVGHGYVGHSRSVNSKVAIDRGVVPISQIDRDLIDSIDGYKGIKHQSIFDLPVALWKMTAKKHIRPEIHHTGRVYRSTAQYDIYAVADVIDSNPAKIKAKYKQYRHHKKQLRDKRKKSNEKPATLGIIEKPSFVKHHGNFRFDGDVTYLGYVRYARSSGRPWLITKFGKKSMDSVDSKKTFSNLSSLEKDVLDFSSDELDGLKDLLSNNHVLLRLKPHSKPTYLKSDDD